SPWIRERATNNRGYRLFGLLCFRLATYPQLPPYIEEHRDRHWNREETACIQSVDHAERFIEQVGFAACMTDSRRPGPSLYIAVCGRRDAVMPRNVQKDPESSHTWRLKDELLRRGRVYYGKLPGGRATFLAPRMIPAFKTLFGCGRREEKKRLSQPALRILRVLRKEWEMGTADLRKESRVDDRTAFTRALDELQAAMIVIPTDVIYEPKFSYLWGLAEERFPEQLARRMDRPTALSEVARCFLNGAGLTVRGELAKVTGLSRPDAGKGNRALVYEGYAVMISPGNYRLASLKLPV
ncbi:MAG TPA: hypothetical protein VKY31_02840, partial [Terriglobia bacterium]|nr:hypothetical protein [Terriglobia bacterium]